MLVPSLSLSAFATALGVVAILFLGYACRNIFHIGRRSQVEHSDHLWYGIVPAIGYAMMLGSAALLLWARSGGMEFLAVALAVLVVSSIRNAWDLILYFVQQQGQR